MENVMKLFEYMRSEEASRMWALRWVIFGQFCVAGFAMTVTLDATSGWVAPKWLWWLFVGGLLWVALLASIAHAVNPPGGRLRLPLGNAVLPAMPTLQPMKREDSDLTPDDPPA
jgi:hypothetical protein